MVSGRTEGTTHASLDQEEAQQLLRCHAPVFHFDALECLRLAAIDGYLARSIRRDTDDEEVDSQPPPNLDVPIDGEWRFDPLPDLADAGNQERSEALLESFRTETDLRRAGTCYGRVVFAKATVLLQYWLFYVDNPYVWPVGRHDGDWEFAQLRLARGANDQLRPTHLTLAQHGRPETRKHKGGARPDVFVAVGSHACYFTPGAHRQIPLLPDECDAAVRLEELTVKPITESEAGHSEWANRPARWGLDRGPGTWLWWRLGGHSTPGLLRWLDRSLPLGDSPVSPGWQGDSWDRPESFYRRGLWRRHSRRWFWRAIHFVGRATWPRAAPEVTVSWVAPSTLSVRSHPTGGWPRRISRVMVSFEEVETGRPVGMRTVVAGQTPPRVHVPATRVRWRAAGYNWLRQRGHVLPTRDLDWNRAPREWRFDVSGSRSWDRTARGVFEGALIGHLNRSGACRETALTAELGWFWLRLTQREVRSVIEGSRGDGLIAPLGQTTDASGHAIAVEEWAPTDRGRQLKGVRALSLRDVVFLARGLGGPVVSDAQKYAARAAGLLTPFLPFLALNIGLTTSEVVVAGAVIFCLVIAAGMRGESALRHAANHWPRLETCRPDIYRWQTRKWRVWQIPPVAWFAAAYVLGAAAVYWISGAWSFHPATEMPAIALIALFGWLFFHEYWREWLVLARRFRVQRQKLDALRRDYPDHPCAKGHACRAAQLGPGVTCPMKQRLSGANQGGWVKRALRWAGWAIAPSPQDAART